MIQPLQPLISARSAEAECIALSECEPAPATIATASRFFQRSYRPALFLIILVASLLRLAGIFDDFWLDEIWSWRFARDAHSASEILLGPAFHHDNNHVLNTMFLYVLGDRQNWCVYRLLSLATGTGIVLIAGSLMI